MMRIASVAKVTPLVVAPLALPPPIDGQTLINASVVQRLKHMDVRLKVVNTSPRSHRRTIFYHLRRIGRVCPIPFVLGINAWRAKRYLYTVVEPGHGMAYNFFIVAFARLFGYELFLHHHASSYAKVHDGRFSALCTLAGKGAIHITLCEQMAQDLTNLYRSCTQAIVAHNASHIRDPGTRECSCRCRVLTIGFLANLSLEKGLDTVLQSFEAIRAHGIEARLLLAGPILDKRARALIREARAKLGEAIIELGTVSGESKEAFFEAIDLFFFPSRYRFEAQPLVILESLSHGAAVLATRHGYVAEIVEPLGTATEATNFVAFAVEFASAWSRDPDFAAFHRRAARWRFIELVELSRRQNLRLLGLLTGIQGSTSPVSDSSDLG